MGLRFLLVLKNSMDHGQDCILCVSVPTVGELQGVLERSGSHEQSMQHHTLHAFEGDARYGSMTIVLEDRLGGFLGTGMTLEGLQIRGI